MSRAVDVGGGSRFRLHRPAQPAPASAYYTYIYVAYNVTCYIYVAHIYGEGTIYECTRPTAVARFAYDGA